MSTSESPSTAPAADGSASTATRRCSRCAGSDQAFRPGAGAVSGSISTSLAGQVTALIGDNGAGKSVMIKTIAGLWAPDEGELVWEGQPVHLHGPRDAEAVGITTIYQDLALCENLDIVQNMFLGHEPLKRGLLDEATMEISARDAHAS